MFTNIKPVKLDGKKVFPVWSGNQLSKMYERFHDSPPVGEVWETSVEPEYEATVIISDNEILFSDYLKELNMSHPPLVKLLDAKDPLSIQVHPDEDAAKRFGSTSKSEMWYILSAEPDSSILYGIKPDIDNNAINNAIDDGSIDRIMNRILVNPGDVFMLPPGILHSLGGGITVLEVQNKVGTTYRVKDICSDREVHKEEAKGSYKNYSVDQAKEFLITSTATTDLPIPGEIIADNTDFSVTRYVAGNHQDVVNTKIEGVYLFCENGHGETDGVKFKAGDSLYLPSPERIILAKNSSVIFVI